MEPIVIKIGGGAITFKDKPFSIDSKSLKSISRDISKYLEEYENPLLIVHGGGSFGHPVAKKYLDKGGFTVEAFLEVGEAMKELNRIVVRELRSSGVNAYGFQTSSHFILRSGEVCEMWIDPIIEALKRGVTPVLYGDIVVDVLEGYSILSGDTVASIMIRELKCKRGYFATSVDGVYEDGRSRIVEELVIDKRSRELKLKFEKTRELDVTGGMYKKLLEISKYCPENVEVVIFNGKTPGNVYKVLREGKLSKSTIVKIKG